MPKFNLLIRLGRFSEICEKCFWKSWWVCLVVLTCLIIAEQGLKATKSEYDHLQKQLMQLELEKEKALALRENLKLQINSQSDPAWVELTLKKGLGLSPEGQKKFLFTD